LTLPRVAIVGRPNVGKSTLFNRMARRRISIVAPEEGVTRDRVSTVIEAEGRHFEITDTAGAHLSRETDAQTEKALDSADLVLLVVDVRAGLLPGDETMARMLASGGRKVLLVANKTDDPGLEDHAAEFHKLGIDPVIPCSAKNGFGISDLVTSIAKTVPRTSFVPKREIRVAIAGRRNAGKSTLLNLIAGEDRVVVSSEPGTTRDSVDVTVELKDGTYTFIDTAGMLRRTKVREAVEFYSLVRSREAIRRCDVILFIVDCTVKIGRVDKQLGAYISRCGKPCVLVLNKWDLVDDVDAGAFESYVDRELPALSYCPVSFASAETGFNVQKTLRIIPELYGKSRTQLATSRINKALKKITDGKPPPARKGKRLKIFYATQTAVQPPTFTLFVNDPELVTPTYRRFVIRSMRDAFDLDEVPVRLHLKERR
jgi:GTP-binding protein